MADLIELIPDIKPDVPTAPDLSIQRYLILSAIEFFRESEVWKVDLDSIALVEHQSDYTLTVPKDTRTTHLNSAVFDGRRKLTHVTSEKLKSYQRLASSHAAPLLISLNGSDISLWPTPDKYVDGKFLQLTVTIVPKYITVSIPDELLEEWRLALTYGAKSKLFLSPKKEWTDINLAQYYQQLFRSEIQRAKAKSIDNGGVGVRVSNRFFSGSRRRVKMHS
ncbi:hypothetical protein [Pleionea sp. CnH1-48]|uniref:phage adaptor protein n=1 Tax=Pleionea sp. CnH1-48 TaxID=2954494 RepID=UPI002098201D|nr:hypothetical protein [Pleionea sp. CnH1-48]MCO7225928.1 hypothetical protein [Pleionea sp. CnH1-48]